MTKRGMSCTGSWGDKKGRASMAFRARGEIPAFDHFDHFDHLEQPTESSALTETPHAAIRAAVCRQCRGADVQPKREAAGAAGACGGSESALAAAPLCWRRRRHSADSEPGTAALEGAGGGASRAGVVPGVRVGACRRGMSCKGVLGGQTGGPCGSGLDLAPGSRRRNFKRILPAFDHF